MPALLTTEEAARYLAVAPYALHRDRATGRLDVPFVQIGKAVRYRQEALDEWIKGREVAPPSIEDIPDGPDAIRAPETSALAAERDDGQAVGAAPSEWSPGRARRDGV